MAKPEDINRDLFQEKIIRQNKRKFEIFEEEIELSLGLSLNGRFGFDPNRSGNAPLVRSSSVSNFMFSGGGAAEESPEPAKAAVELGRTWSMPSGTGEEWRRRKEAQSARRMEAKRKRVERMMSGRMGDRHVAARAEGGPTGERHVVARAEGGPTGERHVAEDGPTGERHVAVGLGGEAEGRTSAQVPNIPGETRSPSSVQSQQNEQKQTVPIEATQKSKQSSTRPTNNEPKEMMKNMMADMPCVSTRGVGPNGKKIEGFLYRYRKGEEVRIVCVCHGSFLSPAEFVKHAGGGDVSQPLKHIVVNPSPLM